MNPNAWSRETTSNGLSTGSFDMFKPPAPSACRRTPTPVGLTVLQQHLDHLCQVAVQLVEGLTLGVSPRKSGDVPDE